MSENGLVKIKKEPHFAVVQNKHINYRKTVE